MRCTPKRSHALHRAVARKKQAKRPTPKRPDAHKRKTHARPVGSGHAGTGSRCALVDGKVYAVPVGRAIRK